MPRPAHWSEVLRVGLGASRALSFAQSRGVLHRDVKPANILESETGELKLVDFGLAKLGLPLDHEAPAGEAMDLASLDLAEMAKTATGTLVGTPLYVAPEVWQGAPGSAASDVFALGLVLYELATGAIPHADLTPPEIAVAVITRDLVPLSSARGTASAVARGGACGTASPPRPLPERGGATRGAGVAGRRVQ
ncbi:MAG: Adenylate cyclase [Polyangiaceae bacterium]|jgi:serine/threonine protein kinase|nr:Adenylate cyclase [Polyangiaceae bacterium]